MKDTIEIKLIREAFERWISSPPFEMSIERTSLDETKSAFPGVYRDSKTDLAWYAWQDAWRDGVQEELGWILRRIADASSRDRMFEMIVERRKELRGEKT